MDTISRTTASRSSRPCRVVFCVAALPALAVCSACSGTVTVSEREARKNQEQVNPVGPAVSRADKVYADPRFWALVESRPWLGRVADTTVTSGRDVRTALGHIRPTLQSYRTGLIGRAHVPFLTGSAYAETTSCVHPSSPLRCGSIKLNRKKLSLDTSLLVNTIAHEVTHVIGDGEGPCGCIGAGAPRFMDDGHTDETKVWLVSYTLGDLAQCFDQHGGDSSASTRCLDRTLNRWPCNRRVVECCATGSEPNVLKRLREASNWCNETKTKCPPPAEVSCRYRLEAAH